MTRSGVYIMVTLSVLIAVGFVLVIAGISPTPPVTVGP